MTRTTNSRLALSLLAVAACALAFALRVDAQEVARVRSLKGDVTVERAGSKTFAPATVGEVLRTGDVLATDVDSNAVLAMPAGANSVLRQNRQTNRGGWM